MFKKPPTEKWLTEAIKQEEEISNIFSAPKENQSEIMLVSNIVEENGKTIKENNLEKEHKYPIGALVTVSYQEVGDDRAWIQCTGTKYVVGHTRDCDGSPLYRLALVHPSEWYWCTAEDWLKRGSMDQMRMMAESNYKVSWGHGEDTLSLATPAKEEQEQEE